MSDPPCPPAEMIAVGNILLVDGFFLKPEDIYLCGECEGRMRYCLPPKNRPTCGKCGGTNWVPMKAVEHGDYIELVRSDGKEVGKRS